MQKPGIEQRRHRRSERQALRKGQGSQIDVTVADRAVELAPACSQLPNGFNRHEISFRPSDKRQIITSSEGKGWSGVIAMVTIASGSDEYAYMPATAIHLGLSLQPLRCEIESDNFCGIADVALGATSILVPQSRVNVKSFTPTSTFHAYLKPGILTGVSEEIYGRKFDYIDLIPHFGGSDMLLSGLMYSLYNLLRDKQNDHFRNEYTSRAIAAHILTKFAQSVGARKCIDARAPLTRNQIHLVTEFLSENLHGKFYLEDLAASVGLGRTTFCKRFSYTMRQTPNQYLQKLRVSRAQELLRRPDLTLAEVALLCGFSDQSHLSRFFVRYLGMTPGRYRLSV